MEEQVQSDRKSNKENSLLAVITNQKLINIVCVLVIISSSFMLYRRVMIDWVNKSIVDTVSYIHGASIGIPFYALILLYFVLWFPQSRFTKFLNRITKFEVLAGILGIGIVICFVLFAINVPAMLSTWTSMAVLLAGILIVLSLLKDRVPCIVAVLAAIAINGMWIGFWEMPYQTALKLIYDMPQVGTSIAINWVIWEILVEVPMAGCGLWTLIIINKKYHIVSFNTKWWIAISIYTALTITWITTGFWVDVWYDWNNAQWIQTTEWDKLSMFIYKASKAAITIAFVSLVWSKKNETNLYNSNLGCT